ncbi:hypothetical protein ACNQGP_04995 [Flavobacterium sp. GT2N3]|uniref:hypothetical protein n=1 Tax=unclassified Flavobacterium TaxID=196869 RepID=UPI003AAD86D2
MKNSMKIKENDFQLISVVIPSLNGNYAKLLFLTGEEYDKLKKTSKSNSGKGEGIYALYAESNMYHDILTTGTGVLTRRQFDELLKNGYNSKMQKGRNGVELKQVV